MAAADNLTGVWDGEYRYPRRLAPTPFTAVLIESGTSLTGAIHETAPDGPSAGKMTTALVSGGRDGSDVRFTKTYDAGQRHASAIHYRGEVNAAADQIDGRWTIPGQWSGDFVMIRAPRPSAAEVVEDAVPETVG